MSIVLRTNKGSALTYDEMDRNLSQFFYSGSVSPDGASLRLHFTGSDALDLAGEDYSPRYVSIPFPANDITIPQAVAAGNNTEIQYNNNGVFGASSNLVFKDNKLGIGEPTPSVKVDVRASTGIPAKIALRGRLSNPQAEVDFYDGTTLIGKIGRTDINQTNNIYITNNRELAAPLGYGKVHISIGSGNLDDDDNIISTFKTGNLFGVGTKDPNRQGSFVGAQGIGISLNSVTTNQSYLSPIPSSIYSATTGGLKKLIPNGSDENGLLISSPNSANGGNIIVALNTDNDQKEGFNIIKSISNTNGSFAGTTSLIATFQASGKVGINTNFPSDVGLTVAGNISGSGTLQVGTIATGTADSTSALVATSTGLVQKIAAAPVPLGGIIMWSGAIANIPDGWTLCDGTGGANGVTVPNLTERFIVGAGLVNNTSVEGDLYNVGGTGGFRDGQIIEHTHPVTVTLNDPGHRHVIQHRVDSSAAGNFLTLQSTSNSDEGSWSSNSLDDGNLRSISSPTNISVQSASSTKPLGSHTATNRNLPPYYALAFIIYVGA
jgi:hypothetical protein